MIKHRRIDCWRWREAGLFSFWGSRERRLFLLPLHPLHSVSRGGLFHILRVRNHSLWCLPLASPGPGFVITNDTSQVMERVKVSAETDVCLLLGTVRQPQTKVSADSVLRMAWHPEEHSKAHLLIICPLGLAQILPELHIVQKQTNSQPQAISSDIPRFGVVSAHVTL